MNRAAVRAIVRKDLLTVVRNRGVRIPLLVTPVVLLVLLPTLLVAGGEMLVGSGQMPIATGGDGIGIGSAEVQQQVGGDLDGAAQWVVFILEIFIAPLFLLVPLIVATVIAADSFAGERERGTLEALLHTPTSDRELMTAKFLSAWLPAVTVALVSFVAYSVLANLLGYPALGRIFFPTPTWLILGFWVTPAIAALGLGVMVIASSRVQSLQAAHQVGSLLVLPVLLLLIAQITGLLLFDTRLVAVLGLLIWIAAGLTLLLGVRSLRRERLALRL